MAPALSNDVKITPKKGDILIRGGHVVTMNTAREVLHADILVRGNRIVAIEKSIRARDGVRIIDAKNAAVIPGFVQAHVHLCQTLFRGLADDLPLLDWLRDRIWPLEAAHTENSLYASARLGLAEMMKAGTTTILDMGTAHHQHVIFEAMKELKIRGFSGKAMMDTGDQLPKSLREKTSVSVRTSADLFDAWNGKADGRIGYAFAPRFILSCTEKLLREVAAIAKDRNAIVHSHAAEHAAERAAVKHIFGDDDVAVLARFGITGERTVLAHGVQLRAQEMRALAKAGTRFVHCPSANLKLASGIANVPAMKRAGMVVGLGADGAPCNNRMDPFTEMRQAALLAKVAMGDAKALSAMDALALATIDGARVLRLDHEIGSIEVGKKADLAVVDLTSGHIAPATDPVSALVYSCTPSDVRHVLVDGTHVVGDNAFLPAKEGTVLDQAKREVRTLLTRAQLH